MTYDMKIIAAAIASLSHCKLSFSDLDPYFSAIDVMREATKQDALAVMGDALIIDDGGAGGATRALCGI